MQTVRDPLAAYNERVKLFANFMNATGLGLIGFAVLPHQERKLDDQPSRRHPAE